MSMALIFSLSLTYKSINDTVMAIKKQFIKTKPVCKVTFSVQAKDAAKAAVVGDFNNWDLSTGALIKLKNGTFKGVFEVNKEASYEFKYVIDGAFVNDQMEDKQSSINQF